MLIFFFLKAHQVVVVERPGGVVDAGGDGAGVVLLRLGHVGPQVVVDLLLGVYIGVGR